MIAKLRQLQEKELCAALALWILKSQTETTLSSTKQ